MSEHPPLLSPSQRRIVGFSLSFLALALAATLFFGVFILLSRFISFFSGVIWPLAVAGIIALILRPLVELLEKKLRLTRPLAVVILYTIFALLVAGVLLLILPPLIGELIDFAAFLPELVHKTADSVRSHVPEWIEFTRQHIENPKVKQLLDNLLANTRSELQTTLAGITPTFESAGAGAVKAAGFLAHVFMVPIYLFFFLLLRNNLAELLRAQLVHLRPSWRDTVHFLINEFVSIVVTFFRSQLLICLIVGILYGVSFTCVGLKYGMFIGLAMGLANIIPYLGATLGFCTIIPLAFFQPDGGLSTMLLTAGAFAIVQTAESWIITPRIMGNSTGLHPLVIIIALFFWGTAFNGLLGAVLAIPLTAFFVTAWRLVKQRTATTPDKPPSP